MNEPQAWSWGERLGLVAGALGVLAVLFALGAVLHLGPFERKELSQGELLAQGDEICRRAHDAFEDFRSSSRRRPTRRRRSPVSCSTSPRMSATDSRSSRAGRVR